MRRLVSFGFALTLIGPVAVAQGPPQDSSRKAPTSFAATTASSTLPQNAQSTYAGSPPGAEPESSPQLGENLQKFDPNSINLTWSNNHWVLTDGRIVLKDFGRKESEGQVALRLIRLLQLNQYGTVGTPAPLMEYWLRDGLAPHGPVAGCNVLTFDAATLHIEESLGQWCVRDARRVLINFGARADVARQAFALLRKYEFSQVAVVGQLTPSMFVFLANEYRDALKSDHAAHQRVTHETPETTAKKAEELNRLKERVPGLEAETVLQPALRPLRTPNQPHQPFSPNAREYGGDGLLGARNSQSTSTMDFGDRVPFDWRQVQIRLEGNDWKLAAGNVVLASFGSDGEAARRALDAVRYYRFTELRIVGRPQRHFSYFLVNGLAPRGLPFGMPGESFQPGSLKLRLVEGRWALCTGDKPLILLGEEREEAADLQRAIVRQQFDHLFQLGQAENGFSFLVRTR